ncbi:MAG: PKD domain-containing protein [Flavisolibacter sp.]
MRKFYLLVTLVAALLFQNINAQDVAGFNFTIGANNLVNFTNTTTLSGQAERKAIWSFGDGSQLITSTLSNAQHQYTVRGNFTVCLRIYKYTNAGTNDTTLSSQICKTITIQNETEHCTANFTDHNSTTSPLIKIFTAQPQHNNNKKPEKICWEFGDGKDTCIEYNPAIASNYALQHTYTQAGEYKVCIRIKYQGGCETYYCRVIRVGLPIPDICKADFKVEQLNSSALIKQFVAIPSHAVQKKPVRICWIFGDGKDTCIQYSSSFTGNYSVNHQYAQQGQYEACVKIFYEGGCEAKKCKPVIIPAPPIDSCQLRIFQVQTNTQTLEKAFYAMTSSDKIAEKICWSFGDGTDTCINLPNPLTSASLAIRHRFPSPGLYRVCAKVLYARGCTVHHCIEVIIRNNTNICGGYFIDSLIDPLKFLFKGFSIMSGQDQVVSWRWTFGDGKSASGQNVRHEYTQGGSYEVCLYSKTALGCETRICKKIIARGTTSNPQLHLSPNPVVTILHAEFQSFFHEQVNISIYNANGIEVRSYSKNVIQGMNSWDFNLSTLPAGVYSVIVSSPHQLANALFFKQ